MKGIGRGAALAAAAICALWVTGTAYAAGDLKEGGTDLPDAVGVSEEVGVATQENPTVSTQFCVVTIGGPEVWGDDVTVYVGDAAALTVSAKDGVLPYHFTWYRVLGNHELSEPLFEGDDYEGNVYTIPNAQTGDAGVYRVVLTDKYGSRAECDLALAVLTRSNPGGGDPGGRDPDDSVRVIAPLIDRKIIEEIPIPLAWLPETGDGSAPALAFLLLAVSGTLAAALASRGRKPGEDE